MGTDIGWKWGTVTDCGLKKPQQQRRAGGVKRKEKNKIQYKLFHSVRLLNTLAQHQTTDQRGARWTCRAETQYWTSGQRVNFDYALLWCHKFVWQVQKANPCPKPTTHLHPPLSVHYKSLVIGLLPRRQVLLSGGALWAAWRSPCGEPSHLVLAAQVCSPRASAFFFSFEGTSCRESRVDQRTSQRATTLPVKLRTPGSVRSATLRAFETARPLLWGNPTPLSRLCRSCQLLRTYPLN